MTECRAEFNCPVCNPPLKHDPDIVKAMKIRMREGKTGITDQSLMLKAIKEIEKLREYVRTLTGQLAHVGSISTTTAENVRRNLKLDGGWNID